MLLNKSMRWFPVYRADYLLGNSDPVMISFRSKSGNFSYLELYGETVGEENYKITRNSDDTYTIEFTSEYLSSLTPNVYDFILHSDDGIIIFRITVI